MSKSTKIWIISAVSLIVFGLALFAGVMKANNWDFDKLNTVKCESQTYQINEDFDNIEIKAENENIVFQPSDDKKCKVIFNEPENIKYTASVSKKTLVINTTYDRKWYDYIGIMMYTPKITVYLPESKYVSLLVSESTGDIKLPDNFAFEKINISASTGSVLCSASASDSLKIKLSTGDIILSNVSANSLDLSSTTGKIEVNSATCKNDIRINVSTGETMLTDVSCGSLSSEGSTGDIFLTNVIASEKFSIDRSTGDVKFDRCDASEIFVETSTGDVNGSLLSNMVFVTGTDTGSVNVPKTQTGGRCKISTDTGDISIKTE